MKAEREAIGWALAGKSKPALPCTVTLTRVAPSSGLDGHDNLRASLKACVDAVAAWIGIDDADFMVGWRYAQRRGPWAVEVAIHG